MVHFTKISALLTLEFQIIIFIIDRPTDPYLFYQLPVEQQIKLVSPY